MGRVDRLLNQTSGSLGAVSHGEYSGRSDCLVNLRKSHLRRVTSDAPPTAMPFSEEIKRAFRKPEKICRRTRLDDPHTC